MENAKHTDIMNRLHVVYLGNVCTVNKACRVCKKENGVKCFTCALISGADFDKE